MTTAPLADVLANRPDRDTPEYRRALAEAHADIAAETAAYVEPTFTTHMLTPHVHLRRNALTMWVRRHFGAGDGSGYERRFTLDDAVRIVGAVRLLAVLRGPRQGAGGGGVEVAHNAVADLLDGPAEGVFVWDGFAASYGTDGFWQLLDQARGVAAIDLDAVRRELLETA